MIRFLHNLWRDALQSVILLASYMGVLAALALLTAGYIPHAGLVGGISLAVIWFCAQTEGL